MMKKPLIKYSKASLSYRLVRKYRNLNSRIRELLASQTASEAQIARLVNKLKRCYARIARILSRSGVKLAGTAMALAFATTMTHAQSTITFQSSLGNPLSGVDIQSRVSPAFADLDDDGDLDAFVGNGDGKILYFQNDGNNRFTQQMGTVNPFDGVDVDSNASPTFADLDGDDDLDAFLGNVDGEILYFQNDGSNGFTQQTSGSNPFNGVDVGWYASPTFADLDEDGDLDAFVGNGDGEILYFQNDGSNGFAQQMDGNNPFNDENVGWNASPTFADLDDDGDLDAFVGNDKGKILYYQNEGINGEGGVIKFSQQTGDAVPFDGVDVGYYASPVFADLDGDGDLDAFVGNDDGEIKYFEFNGTDRIFRIYNMEVDDSASPAFADLDDDGDLDAFVGNDDGKILYFQNDGNNVFTQQTGTANPFNGVDVDSNASPTFADLDDDDDLDAFVGNVDGKILYFQNDGNNVFTQQTDSANPFDGVDIGWNASPTFADLDGDYDLDAFVGDDWGKILYYQNEGINEESGVVKFTQQTDGANPFDGVDVGWTANPTFADLDGDEDLDAFVGNDKGEILYYQNNGDTDGIVEFDQQTDENNPFGGVDVGRYASPVFADLDGDGDLDAFVGAYYGEITYYENISNLNAPVITSDGGEATVSIDVDENETAVTTVTATDADGDAISYSLSGGADRDLFSIESSTGALTFKAAPDFENPSEANANNSYEVEVTVTDDGTGSLTDSQTLTISVVNLTNENSPVITSDGGEASVSIEVDENETAVTTVTAADADGDEISYGLSGGADRDLFGIDSSTGALTFKTAPDFENPSDANADNSYEVEITATDDGAGNLTDSQGLTIRVVDLEDQAVTVVNEFSEATLLSVYPNPTSAIIHINAKEVGQLESIRLFDIQGRQMVEQMGSVQNTIIDLSPFDKGIYLLDIQTREGERMVRKIIKR